MRRGLRPLFFFQLLPLPLHATEVVGKPISGQQQFTQLLSEPGCCFFFAGFPHALQATKNAPFSQNETTGSRFAVRGLRCESG